MSRKGITKIIFQDFTFSIVLGTRGVRRVYCLVHSATNLDPLLYTTECSSIPVQGKITVGFLVLPSHTDTKS